VAQLSIPEGKEPACQTSGAFFAVDIARHSRLTAGRFSKLAWREGIAFSNNMRP